MPAKKKAAPAEAAPKKQAKATEKPAEKKKNGAAGPELTRAQIAHAVMQEVNTRTKGRTVIVPTKELELTYLIRRVPTGIISLDVALGGGFPCAGITQLIGRRNCGKTYLYWRAIAELQRILGPGLSVLLAMNELHADISQARKAGVIIAYSERMITEFAHARHKNGLPDFTPAELDDMRRQVGTFHEVCAFSGEDLYQAVLDGIWENAYHFIAIDSIANVMSEQESKNESLHDKTRGGAASVNTQFVHKIQPLLMTRTAPTKECPEGRVRDPCVVVVNQIRDDQKNPDAPYKNTGGHALEHAKFVDIFLSPGQTIHEDALVRDPVKGGTRQRREVYGKEVNWQIVKGKAGIHEGERGSWLYYFNDSRSPVWARDNVDFYTDAALFSSRIQAVEQAGAWYTVPGTDPKNPLLKVCGAEAFAQELYDDEMARRSVGDPNTIMKRVRDLCYQKKGINLTYEWKF